MPPGVDDSAPRLEAIQATPLLRERVFDALEQIIVDGDVALGAHLREDDLAKRLGVSRNPVREALQTLVYQGLADHQPGKGVFVHSPSPQEIDEVFHTRVVLESESIRLAASVISDSQLVELSELVELGQRSAQRADAHELLELEERFHDLIITAGGNLVIARMLGTLRRRVRWYSSSVVVTDAVESWQRHRQLVAALRDRDGPGAARLMAEHLKRINSMIRDHGVPEGTSAEPGT